MWPHDHDAIHCSLRDDAEERVRMAVGALFFVLL